MSKESIQTDKAPAAIGPYSQAIKTGDLVFMSGQVPLNPASMKVEVDGVAEQTKQVMDNLAAVLGQAGLNFSNVVKTTIFLADMNDFATVNEVYGSYLQEPYPARATIQVARLPLDVKVEIEAIART